MVPSIVRKNPPDHHQLPPVWVALWDRKIDLPLSSISGCSLAAFHSLKVYTLKRTYCFPLLKNPCTLYNILITLTYKA